MLKGGVFEVFELGEKMNSKLISGTYFLCLLFSITLNKHNKHMLKSRVFGVFQEDEKKTTILKRHFIRY